MVRALITALVLLSTTTHAQDLALKRRYEHHFDTPGWSLYSHGSRLVAFNRQTLEVEILRAQDGELLKKSPLDSNEYNAKSVDALSTTQGDFLIALAGPSDNMVEWHNLNGESPYEVHVASAPIALKLVEGRLGKVYLVVATQDEVAVYQRQGALLKVIQSLRAHASYKQVQAFRSSTGLVVLTLLESDHTVRVVQLDVAGGAHEDLTLHRPSNHLESIVDPRSNDFMSAMIGSKTVRFYVEGQGTDSAAFSFTEGLGANQWIRSADGRPLFAMIHRSDLNSAQLSVYDPRHPSDPVRLGVGDARSITEIGSFTLHGKTYYHFVRDHKFLYIQNDGEVSAVPARQGEIITSVQLVKAARGLAVILESPTGSRLQLID